MRESTVREVGQVRKTDRDMTDTTLWASELCETGKTLWASELCETDSDDVASLCTRG